MNFLEFIFTGSKKRKRLDQLRREKEQKDLEYHRELRQRAIKMDRELLEADREILEILKGITTSITEKEKQKQERQESTQ